MKIEYLLDYAHLIPEIAELKFQHYRDLAPEKTVADFQKGLERDLHDKKLPMAFVVIDHNHFVGTFSLRAHDLDTHCHLTPWLGGFFVHPAFRNKGVATFLVQQAEGMAEKLGYDHFYLYTSKKSLWYLKRGWIVLEHSVLNHCPITIMTKHLSDTKKYI